MINIVIDNILLISSPNLLSEKLLPQFIPAPLPAPRPAPLPAPAPGPAPAPTLCPPRPRALDPKGQEPKVFKGQKCDMYHTNRPLKTFGNPIFDPQKVFKPPILSDAPKKFLNPRQTSENNDCNKENDAREEDSITVPRKHNAELRKATTV